MFGSLRFAFSASLWDLHDIIKHKLACLEMASRRHYTAYTRKLVLKSLKIQSFFLKNLISGFVFDFLNSNGVYFKIFLVS